MDTPFHFCENGRKTLDYTADEFVYENIGLVEIPCSEELG